MTSIHSKALGFLKVLVQENAITFQQDRKHNDWTFGYYLNNAYFRLQLAYKKLPSIDQRGDSNLRAVVDEVLDAQVGLANHNEQAETDWENAHKAAEDIFKALAAKNTRRRKGRRRSNLARHCRRCVERKAVARLRRRARARRTDG